MTFTQYISKYEYDADDRLTRELLPTSSSDTQQLFVHHVYDGNGRQSWVSLTTDKVLSTAVLASEKSQFTYLDPGWPRTTKDPAEPLITFDYGARGEQTSRSRAQEPNDPSQDKTELWSYFADGDLKQEVDPHGSPTTYAYDANDNLTDLDDTGGVQAADETKLIAQQSYDGFDRLVKTRQQKLGKPWHFTTYGYDLDDNVVNTEDDAIESPATAGRKTDYTFDQADQVVDQVDHGLQIGCSDDQRVQYAYVPTGDPQDEIVSRPGPGCTDAAPGWVAKQQTTSTYFLDGSISNEKIWNGPAATATLVQTRSLGYETGGIYLNGNIASELVGVASPSAPCPVAAPCTLTYTYDANGRLTNYGNGRFGSTTYAMLPNGMLKTEAFDNGLGTLRYTKTYGYNAPNGVQLNSLRRDQILPTVTHFLKRFFHTHGNLDCVAHDDLDASGNTVTQATREEDCSNSQGGTISSRLDESYGYDDLDRLAGYHAYLAGVETDSGQWTFDALDRVSSETETHTVESVNRTTSFDYIGLTPDAAKETWTGSGATVRNFSFDAAGNKVGVTDSARSKDLLYGYDPHGDISQLLSVTGSATAAYGYRPYGDEEQGTNAISQGDTDTQGAPGPLNNYRYSAARFDTANKDLNMGARFFSPEYGSFLQEDYLRDALGDLDLAGDPLTATRYGLAGGNPVNFVDVDGHGLCDLWSKCRHARDAFIHGFVGRAGSSAKELGSTIWNSVNVTNQDAFRAQWGATFSFGWTVDKCVLFHDSSACFKLGKQVAAPTIDCYREGGVFKALGCGTFDAASVAVLTKGAGAAGKVGRLARLERDIRVSPKAPDVKSLRRPIGQSFAQDVALRNDIDRVLRSGGSDLRVDQQQVNAGRHRVGINRPDLQYTNRFGIRVYIEYERNTRRGRIRGRAHARRLRANDPFSIIKIRYVG